MNRMRLAYELQKHPQDPAQIERLIQHLLHQAEVFEAKGRPLQAEVAMQRAMTWDARKRALATS
jgi:hypothetical protein